MRGRMPPLDTDPANDGCGRAARDEDHRSRPPAADSPRQEIPAVSAVIPCRNEEGAIEKCLQSLLAQVPTPGGFEIIVSDGMSEDRTREIVRRLAERDPRLRLIDNIHQTTPAGMNAGVRAARGKFIAIMGAHNHYAADYLSESVRVLEETGADNVGGVMFCQVDSWMQRAIAAAFHSRFSAGGARWHNPNYEGPAETVFGGVYRKKVFDQIGLFDENLVRNQDDEFNLRLVRAGGKIWQSSRIKSWYKPRTSLAALFRQYMQYGYWKVRVIQKHRIPASVRHLVPATFVLMLTILFLTSLFWRPAALPLAILLCAYVASLLAASAATAAREGIRLFPILPVVFACYHISYGYGFLHGLLDFTLLRRKPRGIFTRMSRTPENFANSAGCRD